MAGLSVKMYVPAEGAAPAGYWPDAALALVAGGGVAISVGAEWRHPAGRGAGEGSVCSGFARVERGVCLRVALGHRARLHAPLPPCRAALPSRLVPVTPQPAATPPPSSCAAAPARGQHLPCHGFSS